MDRVRRASSRADRSDGPVHDPDVLGRGFQTQALPHGVGRVGDGRVHLLAEGHEESLVAFGPLHAQPDATSGLDAPQVAHQGVELRVSRARAHAPAEAVADPVDLVHGEAEYRVDGIPALDEVLRMAWRRHRRHQRARETLAHQRRVGDGRPVGVAALLPQHNAAVGDAGGNAGGAEDRPAGRRTRLPACTR